ncbi:hypothetical protein WNY51_00870 [Pseudocolwellia sp. AS88]|jgi:hypothetical protein|uniref:hypothetical protein n=1 Tax=Pseudocolwellia sp. AS88 TaxID=3063958 RepID=UPI0026EA5FB4|nr:hypothetical protein [Pseudocolwellia sp. AS88]MDO7086383.1 hypothetical protein [Pseudocolwellia sp. AS88]
MASAQLHNSFRKYHRWLGFFLAGIMAIYAISGILLIFRPTEFMKFPTTEIRQLEPGLEARKLGKSIRVKGFEITSESQSVIVFNSGEYNKVTGETVINKMDYPLPLAKLVKLHKATNNSPLFILNISFGITLLFFVISAFLMFMPKAKTFKNGIKISLAGALFALIVVILGS